jgi:predicted Zn finger-like uncharacterized protein
MSLITRCPACGTLFKVVADQLKMSQGWVRCGQCAEVFDAQGHMAGGVSAPSALAPLQTEITTVVAESTLAEAKAAESATEATEATATDKTASTGEATDIHAPAPSQLPAASLSDFADSNWYNTVNPPAPQSRADVADSGAPSSFSPRDSADQVARVGANSSPHSHQPITKPGLLPEGAQAALPVDELPSFVRQAQRAQRWRSPWVRALLLLVAGALLTALAAQIAVQERDRIASQEPLALPWLKELCTVVGCTVGPLKHIEAVVVDASSFNKLRSDGKLELYKLSVNLKNTSALSVAIPHIELSLNDAQDQPVLRRVLNPADLGSAQSVLAPTAELAGSSTVAVDSSQLAGARIAGYRVWAFYP